MIHYYLKEKHKQTQSILINADLSSVVLIYNPTLVWPLSSLLSQTLSHIFSEGDAAGVGAGNLSTNYIFPSHRHTSVLLTVLKGISTFTAPVQGQKISNEVEHIPLHFK